MGLNEFNVSEAIENARQQLDQEENLSTSLKATIELLILIVTLLSQQLGLNSKNSSKPPSTDPNREKKTGAKGNRKPGGQPGHEGKTLKQFDDPDCIQDLHIDRRTLPRGEYQADGYEARQVVDIDISRIVTEYRAQRLVNEAGQRFIAEFPDKVGGSIQYGDSIKAHAVYLSQFQLLPYNRIVDYFREQLEIPVSEGSIYNFNVEAFDLVESTGAEGIIKQRLQEGDLLHADETSINIDGDRHWLHVASNELWTCFYAHKKRGTEAMEEAGILPAFRGILCHDHWKPYYVFVACLHALCNAHHLRELEWAWTQDGQAWARKMQDFLKMINKVVLDATEPLPAGETKRYREQYQTILKEGDIECPPPDESTRKPGQRGRLKRSKSRNLLERLRNFENDTLRFMENEIVPFTNNLGENDIRMTKVHQKISGCFRSTKGAQMFCRIRGYISSCRKQDVSATTALTSLFAGELPEIFVQTAE